MSAQTFVITLSGNTDEILTSSPYAFYDYIPNPPSPSAIDSLTDSDTVSESIRVRIMDGNTADNITEANAIEKILDQARKAQPGNSGYSPAINKVYIKITNATSGDEYQSEIISGSVEWDKETFGWAQWKGNTNLITIYITRRWYWERSSNVWLASANHYDVNPTGITYTAGLPIYNPSIVYAAATISFDSGTKEIRDSANGMKKFKTADHIYITGSTDNNGTFHVATGNVAGKVVVTEALTTESAGDDVVIVGAECDYLEFAAADVAGIVNSPIQLLVKNSTGGNLTYKNIYLGISNTWDIANVVWSLQGEGFANGAGGTVTPVASGGCSGGSYAEIAWTGDTEVEAAIYTVTNAMLAASAGCYYMCIARIFGGTITDATSLRLGWKLGSTVLDERSSLTTLVDDDWLQEIGAVQFPPYITGPKLSDSAPLTLRLMAKQTGGGMIKLDCIKLIPLDGYRKLKQVGYAVANGDITVVDDIIKPNMVYGLNSSNQEYGVWQSEGPGLKLSPGIKQQIHMIFDESDHTSPISRIHNVDIYYRPRRLTI